MCRVAPSLAPPRAARRVVHASWHSRALGLDTAHLNGRSNSKMEPTRLTVRAIMALRRAAHFERWTKYHYAMIDKIRALITVVVR